MSTVQNYSCFKLLICILTTPNLLIMFLTAAYLITLAHLGPALADIHTSKSLEPIPGSVPIPKTLFFPKNWQPALQSKKGESLETTCNALFNGVWGRYGTPEGCESYKYVSYVRSRSLKKFFFKSNLLCSALKVRTRTQSSKRRITTLKFTAPKQYAILWPLTRRKAAKSRRV